MSELKEKIKRFCRTDEAADNLVKIIEQEVAKAVIKRAISELQTILGTPGLNGSLIANRIKELESKINE